MKAKRILIVPVLAAVAIAVGVLYGGWFRKETALQGSGTVEARNIRVGS